MRHRIALLCQSLTGTGGTERVVSTLSELLSERFDVYELSFDAPGSTRHFESPARFVQLGPSLQLPLLLRPVSYIYDAYRLWQAKRRLGVALTISNLWRADLLSILSMGNDRKIAICHINIVFNPTNRLLLRFRTYVSIVYRQFDRVVSVSRPLGDEIRSLFHLEESRSRVIHNCVPTRITNQSEKASQRIRMVWCGRFVTEKNVAPLIEIFAEAFKAKSTLQLVMIGDGPLRRHAEELIARLGLKAGNSFEDVVSDVILTGFVQDPVAYIARCDFQVLPSIAEGLGMVLIEGFSVAVPALASDCSGGGVHDVMGGAAAYRPGRTEPEQTSCGFLLPVPNSSVPVSLDVWRSHILRIAADTELRNRLSVGARARAQLFTPEVVSPLWLQLLNEIL
ncbi:MAG: glycosyltransferase [Burkholderiaceae bacterium]